MRSQRDERASSIPTACVSDSFEKGSVVSTKPDDASGQSWDQLMAAAQVGDVNAYRILLGELASWLRRYYGRRLPPSMTEDAVQDVLLAIHFSSNPGYFSSSALKRSGCGSYLQPSPLTPLRRGVEWGRQGHHSTAVSREHAEAP